VPESMDALVALPGIGRKTANVVWGLPSDMQKE
jgi:endonuclease III